MRIFTWLQVLFIHPLCLVGWSLLPLVLETWFIGKDNIQPPILPASVSRVLAREPGGGSPFVCMLSY